MTIRPTCKLLDVFFFLLRWQPFGIFKIGLREQLNIVSPPALVRNLYVIFDPDPLTFDLVSCHRAPWVPQSLPKCARMLVPNAWRKEVFFNAIHGPWISEKGGVFFSKTPWISEKGSYFRHQSPLRSQG